MKGGFSPLASAYGVYMCMSCHDRYNVMLHAVFFSHGLDSGAVGWFVINWSNLNTAHIWLQITMQHR